MGGGGSKTTPAPPVTATEATLINRHNEYPALFNLVLDYNQDGSGLTWPTTLFIMGLTTAIIILVVIIYRRLRKCKQKRKIKEAEELQEVIYAKSTEPEFKRVKTIRPKSVVYDNIYEEVIIQPAAGRQPAPALPLIEPQPAPALPVAQDEAEPAVVFLDEPEEQVAQQIPQAGSRRPRRHH